MNKPAVRRVYSWSGYRFDKPSSVAYCYTDDHLSGMYVTVHLKRRLDISEDYRYGLAQK